MRGSFLAFLGRLAVAYVGCFLSCGTLGSWSTFVDLLVRDGVFSDGCEGTPIGKCPSQNEKMQILYYLCTASQNVFAVPSGMLFDYQGPRVTGVIGIVIASVSWLLIFFSLHWKTLEPALWVSVPLVQLGMNVGSWGVFGFIFYDARYVGLLTGIANSSFLLSSVVLYIIVAMVAQGVALQYGVLFLLGCSIVAAVISFFSVPSLAEYQESFFLAFGQKPSHERGVVLMFRQLFSVFRLRPWQTLAYFACSASLNICFAYWIGSVFQFNNFNLTPQLSDRLAQISSILYAVMGVFASPVTGLLFDKIGVLWYALVYLVINGSAMAMVWPPVFAVQMVVTVVMFGSYSLWLTLQSKCPAVFAPPELYGSYLGFSNTVTGLLQLALNFLIPLSIGNSLQGRWLYLWPWFGIFACSIVCTFVFIVSLCVSPAPPVPPPMPKMKDDDVTATTSQETESLVN